MRPTVLLSGVLGLCGLIAPGAVAVPVQVEIRGSVEQNSFPGGPLAGIRPNDVAVWRFRVDSDNYVDSPNWPVRGYVIDRSTWSFMVGSTPVLLTDPFPTNTEGYLSIRNNDPGVDGFIVGSAVDQEYRIPVQTGYNNMGVEFLRTFTSRDVFPSVNILDILGRYGFELMSSYDWGIGISEFDFTLITYESIELTRVNTGPTACSIADVCGIGGPPSAPDGLLTGDDFNAFISAFAAGEMLADVCGIGGPPATPDGLITGDDFNAFISAFATGCP